MKRTVALLGALAGLLAALPHTTAAVAEEATELPQVGQCTYAPMTGLDKLYNPYPAVDCTEPHTIETYHVGEWAKANPYTTDTDAYWDDVFQECAGGDPNRYIGGKPERYLGVPIAKSPSTRVIWFYSFPNEEEWNAGARWIRCDVGLLHGFDALQELQGPARDLLEGQGTRGWAWCTKGAPKKYNAQAPVPCNSVRSPWILASGELLTGSRYPGDRKARAETARLCTKAIARVKSVRKPHWIAWWTPPDQWNEFGYGAAYCYANLSHTKWR